MWPPSNMDVLCNTDALICLIVIEICVISTLTLRTISQSSLECVRIWWVPLLVPITTV